MLVLSEELRHLLWDSSDWTKTLKKHAEVRLQEEDSLENCHRLAELAQVTENVVPNLGLARKLYVRAWKHHPHPDWMARAKDLTMATGEHDKLAVLLKEHYGRVWTGALLREEAFALWSAGAALDAVAPLQKAVEVFRGHFDLPILLKAAMQRGDLPSEIAQLEHASSNTSSEKKAQKLRLAARLAMLAKDNEEELWFRAFQADPSDDHAFTILENTWIDAQAFRRLEGLYTIRLEHAESAAEEVFVYHRAGRRLLSRGVVSPAQQKLGIEMLQRSVQLIYQHQLELPCLIALLSLLVKKLVQQGKMPAGVRLLAQALAHPRSDDEMIWIANMGIVLGADDLALKRTTGIFRELRERLVAQKEQLDRKGGDPWGEKTSPDRFAEPFVEDKKLLNSDLQQIYSDIEEMMEMP